MTEYIKIGLDLIILIGLGGFIYYALRLSKALNVFRTYRADFDQVMRDLTKHVDEAQRAIDELKDVSASSGADLRKMVKDAQFLADDLQFMTENGNNLAERLEKAAGKGRAKAQSMNEDDNVRDIARHRGSKMDDTEDDGFTIQDHDVAEDHGVLDELSSEAERELYKALKNAEGS